MMQDKRRSSAKSSDKSLTIGARSLDRADRSDDSDVSDRTSDRSTSIGLSLAGAALGGVTEILRESKEKGQEVDPIDLLAATTQAIAGPKAVVVRGGQGTLTRYRGETIWVVSELDDSQEAAQTWRLECGRADLAALWVSRHDAALHEQHGARLGTHYNNEQSAVARVLFDAMERARVEAGKNTEMLGLRANVNAAINQRYKDMGLESVQSATESVMVVAFEMMIRRALCGAEIPPVVARISDVWADLFERTIAKHRDVLVHAINHQQQYAQQAYALVAEVIALLTEHASSEQTSNPATPDIGDDASAQSSDGEAFERTSNTQQSQDEQDQDTQRSSQQTPSSSSDRSSVEEILGSSVSRTDGPSGPSGPSSRGILAQGAPDLGMLSYKIFNSSYDRICYARELASEQDLRTWRQQLDTYGPDSSSVVSVLARRLQRLLMASRRHRWERDLDEGALDGGRLARLVAAPHRTSIYMQEHRAPYQDTIITILLDNSGSMRGRPMITAAHGADIVARTMERCGLAVEILGFTTCDWKGGTPAKLWVEQGRPPNPGRLNALMHVIYKSSQAPYLRYRHHLGLVMKDGLLKENIDGEALIWASRRLRATHYVRKILMVISDGAPVDDATNAANGTEFLHHHLRDVIGQIESRGDIELLAIGIGHDVGRYYRQAIKIQTPNDLGAVMMEQLGRLLAPSSARSPAGLPSAGSPSAGLPPAGLPPAGLPPAGSLKGSAVGLRARRVNREGLGTEHAVHMGHGRSSS